MASNTRSGGRILIDQLGIHGVRAVFCVPGESYLAALDAFHDATAIRLISCRHEEGAGFMAEAWGKLTGAPGIVFVTRGPGACNVSIAVHTAFQDSTPMILFVGQAPRDTRGREAFQEVDVERMFGWTTKWAGEISDLERIPELVSRAFHLATSGRPGPVVLALPEDMLTETGVAAEVGCYRSVQPHPGAADLEALRSRLVAARRPLMIIGGGGWSEAATKDIVAFAEAFELPTCCTFRCQDLFDNTHRLYAGDLGYALDPALGARLRAADLLLAVGTRLGEVTTGGYGAIAPPRSAQGLIHVYPGIEELGRVFQPELAINAGMAAFAAAARQLAPLREAPWRDWAGAARADYLLALEPVDCPGDLDMYAVVKTLEARLPDDAIIATDAGNFSGWVQRFFRFRRFRSQLGPTNGAMGYGVPAALAAQVAAPERQAVCLVGDGGFLMTGQELATALQYDLAPLILIVNNGLYGTIRMHQEREYPTRVTGTELRNPDFAAMARAFGAFGATVARTAEFAPALEAALAAGGAAVVDLRIDREAISTRLSLSAVRAAALARQAGPTS